MVDTGWLLASLCCYTCLPGRAGSISGAGGGGSSCGPKSSPPYLRGAWVSPQLSAVLGDEAMDVVLDTLYQTVERLCQYVSLALMNDKLCARPALPRLRVVCARCE